MWIGARSFSIYVAHAITFLGARKICMALGLDEARPGPKVVYFLVAFSATFVAAALTYRYVEDPLRKIGRRKTASYLAATRAADDGPVEVEAPSAKVPA